MHINSKDNPRVKLFRKLLSSKKAREEHGLFAVEGARNCVDTAYEAVCGRIKVHSVFYTQTALTKYKNTLKTDSLFSCTRPEDVFENIANIENINVNNVNDVVYAQKLVRQRKREDIQRRF